MVKFCEVLLFNKKFYLGVEDQAVVWADWHQPQGESNPHHPLLLQVQQELAEYQQGLRKKFSFKMKPEGSEFQKRVWKELTKIAWGKTESYFDIATRMKSPQSVRAVASAIGRNPIAIFIPCHRVIAKNGGLGGYSGGLPTKINLLKIEGHSF